MEATPTGTRRGQGSGVEPPPVIGNTSATDAGEERPVYLLDSVRSNEFLYFPICLISHSTVYPGLNFFFFCQPFFFYFFVSVRFLNLCRTSLIFYMMHNGRMAKESFFFVFFSKALVSIATERNCFPPFFDSFTLLMSHPLYVDFSVLKVHQ